MGFCDIDASRFAKIDKRHPGVTHYTDWREMFSKLGDSFDAVTVSTPDHMHALPTMVAMRMGKHVYCQKPLTHTAWEARQLRLQAAKSKVRTQMGNQIHSAKEYRTGVKLIQTGRIGKVLAVHTWHPNRGNAYTGMTAAPASGPVPTGVSWDLWLGCSPTREFAPDVYHPFKWRDWQDFGSGAMGDFGCHILDPVFGALLLTAPKSIVAENAGTSKEVWPGPETITYVFPGTKYTAGSEIQIVWRDGGLKPPRQLGQLPEGVELPAGGSLFIGQAGTMVLPHVGMPTLYEANKPKTLSIPDINGTNHWHDWVDAVIAGKKTTDGFEYAGPLSETVQLGNIAARLPGKVLQWDAANLKIAGDPQAPALLTKTYRKGFEVPAVS